MKKNYLSIVCAFLFFIVASIGCKKEIKEIKTGPLVNICNLVSFDWVGASTWTFHYNEKGLADKWVIDYGDGFPLEETMIYNSDNKLIQANESYQGLNNVYLFTYTGKRVTKYTFSSSGTPGQQLVDEFTYNNKGQMTRQDDAADDIHVLMFYDNLGNTTRTDIYFGSEPYFSDIYTFDKPVRNALLRVPGIDFGFPFYGTANFTNQRWFTSNTGIAYDNSVPTTVNDYDPSKTIFKNGYFDFPLSVTFYDNVTAGPAYNTLTYSCGGKEVMADESPSNNSNMLAGNHSMHTGPMLLLRGSVQSIKDQIQKLRSHSLK